MALYTFLVPFIAPEFFTKSDPIVQLILAYGMTSVGVISRPIGSIFFGRLAMEHNPKTLLIFTLSGVAISTFTIGLIPGYNSIGYYAVIFLFLTRLIQGIFAAGEQSIAGILLLDGASENKRTKMSSYFVFSSMSGATLASIIATLVSISSNPSLYWRIAFMSGIITGIIGLTLRWISFENISVSKNKIKQPILKLFGSHKGNIFKVIFVSSFSYMTFSVPFVFMNKFTPIFGQISFSEMMHYNNLLLIFDMIMVPILGHLASNFDFRKWMIFFASLMAITIIPCFYLLSYADKMSIILIKTWVILLGVAFVTPSKVWMFKLIKSSERYLIVGLGYAIGTEILGRQTTTISWTIWHLTENPVAPALYMVFLSFAAILALAEWKKQTHLKDSVSARN